MNRIGMIALGVLAPLALAACADDMTAPLASTDSGLAAAEAELRKGAPKKGDMTITEIVVASSEAGEPEFTYLRAALTAAGLVDFFNGTDQYTVFAPTDAAFEQTAVALGFGTAEEPDVGALVGYLIANDLLAPVLQYHVTDGRRASNSVVPPQNEREITTLLGEAFYVSAPSETSAFPDNATIEDIAGQEIPIWTADISASNGIIHVIGGVLLPLAE